MEINQQTTLRGAIFITFAGNCKEAMLFYQSCFGGELHFETFESALEGYSETPVVSASLIADRIILHASDLVHNEGRILGNYISIYVPCKSASERVEFMDKLKSTKTDTSSSGEQQQLIELVDAFGVRWLFGLAQ